MNPDDITAAPWTEEQMEHLLVWQASGSVHHYTCGNAACRADLTPERDGWRCPRCDYRQDWAFSLAANGDYLWAFSVVHGVICDD